MDPLAIWFLFMLKRPSRLGYDFFSVTAVNLDIRGSTRSIE